MPQGMAAEAAVDETTYQVWTLLAEAGHPVPVRPCDLTWSDLQRAAERGLDVAAMLSER